MAEIASQLRENARDQNTRHNHFWFVLDCRLASGSSVHSGIGRFICNFADGLSKVLENNSTPTDPSVKILLVTKDSPEPWMIELMGKKPNLVRFFSCFPDGWLSKIKMPLFVWSTTLFRYFQKRYGSDFLWIAPGNVDRPWLLGWSALKRNLQIVQMVHDTIPLTRVKGIGTLFRLQFRLLLSRTMYNLPFVFTCSRQSAGALKSYYPKRKEQVRVLPYGMSEKFGSQALELDREKRRKKKLSLCRRFFGNLPEEKQQELANSDWILGVGRAEVYKNWLFALQVVQGLRQKLALNHHSGKSLVWFHVGFSKEKSIGMGILEGTQVTKNTLAQEEASHSASTKANHFSEIYSWDNGYSNGITGLSDQVLIDLYYSSECLLHPSAEEGFGFPPLEASLCGLPVIFQEHTAVSEHYPKGLLPTKFWMPMQHLSVEEWVSALEQVLKSRDTDSFLAKVSQVGNSRQFFQELSDETKFDWADVAKRFLKLVRVGEGEK